MSELLNLIRCPFSEVLQFPVHLSMSSAVARSITSKVACPLLLARFSSFEGGWSLCLTRESMGE
ncbi:hypothetical protein SLEP1_g21643 [Rubroshorea leprosula]|uniref:Uncharacterized protein n=1 Tax=Rubroshorea leprosula TaxID=152421 RepID=A0AAV5JE18_9ROSI|nr:hypothetical protein SLEP1_g21643 [Rubroshorea leprosula]